MILALPARAKLNTRLHVTGSLADGRHALDTDFVTISLADLVELDAGAGTGLEVTGMALPEGENLVERARAALEAAAGRRLPGRFRVHKRIPPGAGLGGGSSDAATALRALVRAHHVEIDLLTVAREVGADVPFLVCGGAAHATGAGDMLQPAAARFAWYAIAWPGFSISTAAVYAGYDRVGGDGDNHLRRAAEAAEPRLSEFAARLGDDWRMTGSGSAFFTECSSAADAESRAARLDCWTAVAHTVGGWC